VSRSKCVQKEYLLVISTQEGEGGSKKENRRWRRQLFETRVSAGGGGGSDYPGLKHWGVCTGIRWFKTLYYSLLLVLIKRNIRTKWGLFFTNRSSKFLSSSVLPSFSRLETNADLPTERPPDCFPNEHKRGMPTSPASEASRTLVKFRPLSLRLCRFLQ
jgi:hypothetical protein